MEAENRRAEVLTGLHKALSQVVPAAEPEVAFEMGRRYITLIQAQEKRPVRENGEILVHLSNGNEGVREAVDTYIDFMGETWKSKSTQQTI
jgi:hypothetical protein